MMSMLKHCTYCTNNIFRIIRAGPFISLRFALLSIWMPIHTWSKLYWCPSLWALRLYFFRMSYCCSCAFLSYLNISAIAIPNRGFKLEYVFPSYAYQILLLAVALSLAHSCWHSFSECRALSCRPNLILEWYWVLFYSYVKRLLEFYTKLLHFLEKTFCIGFSKRCVFLESTSYRFSSKITSFPYFSRLTLRASGVRNRLIALYFCIASFARHFSAVFWVFLKIRKLFFPFVDKLKNSYLRIFGIWF